MTARLAFVLAFFLWSLPCHAFDVTSCHQTVPPSETGVLQADLVCDSQGGPDVSLSRHSRLDLNGHSISGGYIGIATDPGHIGTTVIEGPGQVFGVDGGDPFGCGIATSGKTKIRNVSLHDNRRGIVNIYDFALELEDVTITSNAVEGIASYFGNLGSPIGPGNGQITGRRIDVSNNGDNGIESYGKLILRSSTVTGNGAAGVVSNGRTFFLQDVLVLNNGGGGVVSPSARRGKLKSSTATGNGPAGDIVAKVAPKLVESTCEHSIFFGSNGTLGICSGD